MLSSFNSAARERTSQTNNNSTNSNTATTPTATELIILHRGQQATISRFNILATVTDHQVTNTTALTTQVLIIDMTTQSVLGTADFSSVGQLITVAGYQLRLVNATPDTIQLIIGQSS